MASSLSQAQQCLEDMHFGFLKTLRLDLLKKRSAKIIAQFVVNFFLVFFHFTEDRLLQLRRKMFGHLIFRSAQDEGTERAPQDLTGLFIAGAEA